MKYAEKVYTGRTDLRRYCLGCEQRIKVGEPRVSNTWAARLRLSKEQVDLLLIAAQEFGQIGGGSPVDFVDWMSIDALRSVA